MTPWSFLLLTATFPLLALSELLPSGATSIACNTALGSPPIDNVNNLALNLHPSSAGSCYDPAVDPACVYLGGAALAQATYCVGGAGASGAEGAVGCDWVSTAINAIVEKCAEGGRVAGTVHREDGGNLDVGSALIAIS